MDPQPRRKTTLGKAQSRTTIFACTNCRRSKVKCDERRPICARGPASHMIKTHIRRILKLVFKLTAKQFSGKIIWPLFVAAVELDPLNDELCFDIGSRPGPGNVVHGRPVVLGALMAVAKSSVSGVSRARYIIQEVWQARDFDLGHPPDAQGSSPASLNDWERYVVPVSDALSLVERGCLG